MNIAGHLSPELLFGYRHRLLSTDELRTVHDHIGGCETCREQLADTIGVDEMIRDVRSSLSADRPPARRFLPYAAAAAAILIGAGASIWVWRFSSRPSGAEDHGGDNAPSVQAALRAGRIPVPAFLDQLTTPREKLMGDASAVIARLVSPKATAVLGPSVPFQWEPMSGQWTYQVRVFQLNGEPAADSPELPGTTWLARKLLPGADYQWQVVATRGSERVTLPQPPDTPPRFRVLDEAFSARLRRLAIQHPGAHLLLGVEYAQAGAIEDAKSELAKAARQNSNPDAVEKLLQSLTPPQK